MGFRSLFLILAAGALFWAASGSVHAQPIQGFYLSGGAGLRIAMSPRLTSLEPGVPGAFELTESLGYSTQLSVGYALGNGWRFELEGTLGHGAINGISDVPAASTGTGSVRNLGFMVNALFDLDVRSPYVYPYIGVGIGYQSTRVDNFTFAPAGKPGFFSASGSTGAPAGQAIVGVSFPIPNMPGLSLTVDYRGMGILGGGKYQGVSSVGLPPGSVPLSGEVKFHSQFIHNVMFGVRYAFNTPPPAADASQAAAEPRPEAQLYEVAFDANKSTLSDRGQAIVRVAAQASSRPGTTRIALAGKGEEGVPARPALSGERAKMVVAALVADGVPRDAIAIRAEEKRRACSKPTIVGSRS